MDHVVYVDAKAKELDKLVEGVKKTIVRGAAGRKVPYGKVSVGDVLYFINNNAEGEIRAKGRVSNVFNSEKLTKPESVKLVQENQDKLQLTDKQFARWAGKRYIILIELDKVETVKPFKLDKKDYGNMDDWLPVGEIAKVRHG
ncbi:hypothetical protein ACO1PF_02660 [Alkalibacterium sp. f15]|uniref:hypothetical protein n=1 Tax=Alkalibacterium sp. f15 TaxID=3414029 RepID=UPI003BF8F6DC